MLVALVRFSLRWAIILYFPIAFMTGGWHYHRSCSIEANPSATLIKWNSSDVMLCSFIKGAFWPITNIGSLAVTVTDPKFIEKLHLPSITFTTE